MFLADYHTHSEYSSDGKDSMSALLEAGRAAGLSELCITDHCDLDKPDRFAARAQWEAFTRAREQNQTGVKLLLGIELGEATHNLLRAEDAVKAAPYDFILGAYHAVKDELDFYYLRYTSAGQCHTLLERYLRELCELSEWGRFDVLAHIDYPLRYMRRDGFDIQMLPFFEPDLRRLFGILNDKGIGIELNMNSKGFSGVLSLYRDCGGKTVTVGSDAHTAEKAGRGIAEGVQICRDAGFSAIAAFEQRKVRYVEI